MRRNGLGAAKYHAASLLLACVAAAGTGGALAQISQSPLSLTEGVPPNMIFTLDDSGSMVWAFAPDNKSGTGATRRAKSSAFNPMYYDPTVTYVAPKIITTAGAEQQLSTSFTTAYNNGFDTARGNLNLSNNYKVSWAYRLNEALPTTYGYNSTNPRLAQNTANTSSCQVTGLNSNNSSRTCTVNGVTVTITRTGTSTCTVSRPTGWPAGSCSGSSGTYTAGFASADMPASYVNDFACTVTGLTSGSRTCTVAGTTVTITRSSNTSCTVTTPSGWQAGTCLGSYGSYTASWATAGVPAYYYVHNGSATCDLADDSCYSLVFVPADQQQNFANWYSFYRNRALATLSSASLAFFDLSPSVRLTWQGLGNCNALNGGPNNCQDNGFKQFDTSHKGQFYAWLRSVVFDQSTYLPAAMRRAGEFLKTDTAWLRNPQQAASDSNPVYACRPSYHVAMTDGFWNATTSDPADYRQDQDAFDLPDERRYDGQHPFHDPTTQTLADLAMHYWATDLRPEADNRVPPYVPFKSGNDDDDYWDPRNDPATWQHMVNFMMGLGLTEALSNSSIPWAGGTFTGSGYTALRDGTANWPAASSGSDNNVYDLWHAAINSRGEFFSVDNPDAMVQAFKEIMNRIAERSGTAASPAINSGQLDEAGENLISYSFQTYYYSDEAWAGDLIGYTKRRQINETTGQYELVTEQDWSARARLDNRNWETRNIRIAGSGSTGLQPFTWANAGNPDTAGTLANLLRSDPDNVASPNNTADHGRRRSEFLRGSRADEDTLFRVRRSVLGDMVSSKPVSVRGARYLTGYANSIERNTSYGAFLTAQQTRTPHIYVGANDGMLHAFNAETGAETFAFVPTAVFPNLYRLTGKTYSHQFYVDGTPVVADAYITVGGTKQWRTVLVGTLRAGGKGLFALDITDPANISLLWEFDDSDIPAVDGTNNLARLGYSFPQPTIARLHNGKWAVVTGNGYDSDGHTHGRAALLIIDLETGALTKSIEVQGMDGVANGLSSPRLADMNVDGVADYAYAGDLQGNVWRFNLTPHRDGDTGNPFARAEIESAAVESDFVASYDGEALFTAVAATGEPQPITAAPNIVRHPSRFGYLVLVGTGKYYETPDKSGTVERQSVYGIWDTNTRSTSGLESGPGGLTTGTLTRSLMQQQTFESTETNTRTLTRNPVKWAIPPAVDGEAWTDDDEHKYGWYFDLTQDGEMVIENMILFGQTLLFQTLVPDDDPCAQGVASWTYGVDTQSGGRTRHHLFVDVRSVDDPTRPVTAIRQIGEGGLTLGQRPDGRFEVCTGEQCANVEPDPESVGRQSWRQPSDE